MRGRQAAPSKDRVSASTHVSTHCPGAWSQAPVLRASRTSPTITRVLFWRKLGVVQGLVARRLVQHDENVYFAMQSMTRAGGNACGAGSPMASEGRHEEVGEAHSWRCWDGIDLGGSWGAAGTIINLGFLVRTGSRPDAP